MHPRTRPLSIAAAMLATATAIALAAPLAVAAPDPVLAERVLKLTRGTQWHEVAAIKIGFKTHHPQGMVKIGDEFFVSSVEIAKPTTRYPEPRDGYDRDTGEGVGHLFKIDPNGELLGDLVLGEGAVYHPGGIDYDGESSGCRWPSTGPTAGHRLPRRSEDDESGGGVPLRAITSAASSTTPTPARCTACPGARAASTPGRSARDGKITNADAKPEALRVMNPAQYIDYQDCHYLASRRMLCSGLNNYRTKPDGTPFSLGGWRSSTWPTTARSGRCRSSCGRRRATHDAKPVLRRADGCGPARLLHARRRRFDALRLRGRGALTETRRHQSTFTERSRKRVADDAHR